MDRSLFIRALVVSAFSVLSYNTLCHAEQVLRLTPTEDTYCVNNGTVHGLEPTMIVGHSQYGEWQRVAYLKFDISTVPTQVDSVVLRLYTDGWKADETDQHIFRFYPVRRNDWAEDDISHTNASTKLGERMDSPVLAEAAPVAKGQAYGPAWIEWRGNELTNYILDSAVAARDYISFRLREMRIVKSSADKTVTVPFHSKENTSGFAPELIVYAPDGAEPAERLPYIVVHDSAEARLSSIFMDGEVMDGFDPDQTEYGVYLPYSAVTDPVLTAVTMDSTATYVVNGNSITVTSGDKEHQQVYTLSYTRLPKMDLFLAIGQSNMSGRAPYDDCAGPMENVYLLTPNAGMEISSNPMNKYSNVRKDISVQGQGPHYMFALAIRDSLPDRTIGMVVNAQGGTSLNVWYKPGKTNYDKTVERARKAFKWGEYKGIIWHQGESDVTEGLTDNYATYRAHIAEMVGHLRQDLENDTLWFITGELRHRDKTTTFNEVVVHSTAEYIPYSDYVTSEGTSTLSDDTHWDSPSVQIMGKRYAEKMLLHVYPNHQTTALDEVMQASKAVKVLQDGQMVIVHHDKKTNLLGQTIY